MTHIKGARIDIFWHVVSVAALTVQQSIHSIQQGASL